MEWFFTAGSYDAAREGHREALFALGNGYFVTRAAALECDADGVHYPGTYLAGGYNRLASSIAGRRVENEDLVNLPNWLPLRIRICGGEWFSVDRFELLEYRQQLDLENAVLLRTICFADADGRRTRLVEKRLVHMRQRHLGAVSLELTALDWSGTIDVLTALDGGVVNANVARYSELEKRHLRPLESSADGEDLFIKTETNQSGLRIALAARTRIVQLGEGVETNWVCEVDSDRAAATASLAVTAGEPVSIEKIVALYCSRDPAISECGEAAKQAARGAPDFASLLASHSRAWEQLWRRFGSEGDLADVEAADDLRLALRLHVFHLLQTVSIHSEDLDAGVPARGWHGEAYRGHVFWDELFIFPLLNLRIPEITRALLKYRHRRLEQARHNAREAGFPGAMYPWQSGSDGCEESQTLHYNPRSQRWIPDHSSLQRHVNIAIAYNIWQYHEVTGDEEFLAYHGAEMFLEISRFLASLASFNPRLDRYEILGVMGPDEYHEAYPDRDTPGLDNNSYTNLMTVWVLERAGKLLAHLTPYRCRELREELGLSDDELQRWDDISHKMRLVFHADGVLSQFEGYEDLAELDWELYRQRYGDIHRLDRILEAEKDSPNRYKLSKQADVLMLFYLLSAGEIGGLMKRLGYDFDDAGIANSIDYYLDRTAHGSTLSRVVHAWVLARSDRPRSWSLFREALMSDIADSQQGTTAEGIHLGAMAGSVDILQRCYTGIETRAGALWLDPCLPSQMDNLVMRFRYRNHVLVLRLARDKLKLASRKHDSAPIRVCVQGREYLLGGGEVLEAELKDQTATRAGR